MNDYASLVAWLREHGKKNARCSYCPYYDATERGYSTCSEELAEKAADAIEELTAFAHYVAKKAFDEEWELDPAFCELVCRKLNKIGIVEKDGEYWSYEPPKEET